MLKKLRKRFKIDDKGQGMVEYGLILALISVVALGALSGIGGSVSEKFDEVVDAMSEPVITGGSIYTETEIDNFVSQGYIPILNAEDLDKIRESKEQTFAIGTKWEGDYLSGLDKKYIQVSDINMNGTKNFEPIGHTDSTTAFKGTFDGGGYKIYSLSINSDSRAGLFGYASGATFENIGLLNIDIVGRGHVGGLVGYQQNSSSVSNSYATGKVSGSSAVGGLVGFNDVGSVISNSYADAHIDSSGSNVGGLSGSNPGIIKNSYASGSVNGEGAQIGGLVGVIPRRGSIINSYAIGKVTGSGNLVGGLVGYLDEDSVGTSYSYYNSETTGRNDSGKGVRKTTNQMKDKSTYSNWDFDSIWKITDGDYPTLQWQ